MQSVLCEVYLEPVSVFTFWTMVWSSEGRKLRKLTLTEIKLRCMGVRGVSKRVCRLAGSRTKTSAMLSDKSFRVESCVHVNGRFA